MRTDESRGANARVTATERTNVAASPIEAQLLESSVYFARSAATAYSTESWQLFHLHLATAIELLVKAVLAHAHPSLIADPRANFDSLLHLCGLGDRAKTPDFVAAVRTVSASEALHRVERVVDDYRQPGSRVRHLLELRNGIVHSGLDIKPEAEVTLAEVAAYVGSLLASLRLSPDDYWGDSTAMVIEHLERRLGALEASYWRRLEAAKDRYHRVIEPMDEVSRVAYIAAVASNGMSETFDWVEATCPACGNWGSLSGSPEPDWEADWDVEGGEAYAAGAYVSQIRLDATSFVCRACGLNLGADLLVYADLAEVSLTEKDFDTAAATDYFERQLAEEAWDEY